MNVKTVANPITSLDNVSRSQGKEKVKTFETADRDANGKQEQADQQEKREFTEQELQELIEKMKNLPAVVSANLTVEMQEHPTGPKFVITSPTGDHIRTLTVMDAWESTKNIDLDRPKGQLLNKAM